jgi:hypothetical protein
MPYSSTSDEGLQNKGRRCYLRPSYLRPTSSSTDMPSQAVDDNIALSEIHVKLLAQPNPAARCRTELRRTLFSRTTPNFAAPDQTWVRNSNPDVCHPHVSKPRPARPSLTCPFPAVPYQTEPSLAESRQGLSASRLTLDSKPSILRTPIAQADLRTCDPHPLINACNVDKCILNVQSDISGPDIEDGTRARDTICANTHDGREAEILISPQFVRCAWADVFQTHRIKTERARFGYLALLDLLSCRNKHRRNHLRRQNWTIGCHVESS